MKNILLKALLKKTPLEKSSGVLYEVKV